MRRVWDSVCRVVAGEFVNHPASPEGYGMLSSPILKLGWINGKLVPRQDCNHENADSKARETRIAALHEEMDGIHFVNSLYWYRVKQSLPKREPNARQAGSARRTAKRTRSIALFIAR
jgi:hypothetical protein